jgi:hypothetical protein
VEYDRLAGLPIALLDRNLGALSADTLFSPAVDTYGFVYQWGRKDPFFGGDGLTADEGLSVFSVARTHTTLNPEDDAWGDGVKEWARGEMSTFGTIEQSVRYPMRFIYNETSLSEGIAEWLSGSRADDEGWSDDSDVKTDYDPCPYGYKVPGMNEAELDTLDVLYRPWQNSLMLPSNIRFYNAGNSNRYWTYYNYDAVSMWPVAGMRQGQYGRVGGENVIGAQLKYSGTDNRMGGGYYWTSTPLKIGGRVVPGASYRIEMHNHILYSKDTYGPHVDAYPVRCVKMNNP